MSDPLDLSANFNHMAPDAAYRFGATNYNPIDLGFEYGEGPYLVDSDGDIYLDFIGGYGAVMFGHRHPRIVDAMQRQMASQTEISDFLSAFDFRKGGQYEGPLGGGGLDLTTRNFTYPILGEFTQKLGEFSRIEDPVVLPKNGGGEIVESAVKAMRADGVQRRGIPQNEGVIIVFSENFHGRTSSAVAASDSETVRGNFGPYLPGFVKVPYGDTEAFEAALEANKGKVSGVLVEPIQGEAGVNIPPKEFLPSVQRLCREHNTILCLDEIQSGMGRTGKRWAWEHDLEEAPDMIVTAKALGAGAVAASALVGRREIMEVFSPGTDGATMSGSPLTCAVGLEAMAILEEENLCEASAQIGERLEQGLHVLQGHPLVKDIRIRGAWGAVEIEGNTVEEAEQIAVAISNYLTTECGLVCTPAHGNIRLSPPLNMPLEYIDHAAELIADAVQKFEETPRLVESFTFNFDTVGNDTGNDARPG